MIYTLLGLAMVNLLCVPGKHAITDRWTAVGQYSDDAAASRWEARGGIVRFVKH